ncbi:MAG: trehalose-phosphatase [Pseudomonadota bacterium]
MGKVPDTLRTALPSPSRAALFIDFDGTLVDIAARPDAIVVSPSLPDMLAQLGTCLNGALALVSGRAAGDLAAHLPTFDGIIVGGHGAEWRLTGDITPRVQIAQSDVAALTADVAAFATAQADILLEEKPTGLVLHYRAAPALADQVAAQAERLARSHPAFETHASKMAVELRPAGVGKDAAIADLMATPPFTGRTPMMIGDDTTDEPAMAWAQIQGGLGIKVGSGDTGAQHRLDTPQDVHALLQNWAQQQSIAP